MFYLLRVGDFENKTYFEEKTSNFEVHFLDSCCSYPKATVTGFQLL